MVKQVTKKETEKTIKHLTTDCHIWLSSVLREALNSNTEHDAEYIKYTPKSAPVLKMLEKRGCLKTATLYNANTEKTITMHQITPLGKEVVEKIW